jgi:putative Mg2+ transporter-C (MgtC) family protein
MAPSVWQEIGNTVIREFSDLPDVQQFTRILLRLTLAALLGIEREQKGKAAGVRTHMLVAMGAALFVLLAEQAGMPSAELSRVMQGVIAAIGVAAGLGREATAVLSTLLALGILSLMPHLLRLLEKPEAPPAKALEHQDEP